MSAPLPSHDFDSSPSASRFCQRLYLGEWLRTVLSVARRPIAISGIPQGPMVLSVSQRNNRARETLLRPAARRISRRAVLRPGSERGLALPLLPSAPGRKLLGRELLFSLPENQGHRRQPPGQRQARHLRTHPLIEAR